MPNPKRKLAIICTHPIQYNVPTFRAMSQSPLVDVRVFYTWSQADKATTFDSGFGKEVKWDIPLLEGYEHQFVPNVARHPGPEHFSGLHTPTLTREIEAWKADALLVYTWSSRAHLQALRHFRGKIPIFFRGDSTLLDERSRWRAAMRRAFLTWVYSHVDVAIAVGSNNRDYFEWCGVPLESIALSPHSIDTVRFGADSGQHEQLALSWRQDLGIRGDATVILFAGKLQWQKSPGLLLRAFRAVNDEAHLVFVGGGELEQEVKTEAQTIRNVHFLPFKNQSVMPAVYRLGDIFVLPSKSETWGLAVNESMASGRAVIASTKVGGARDLIRSGENGWIFESGNQSALEDLLRRAIAAGRAKLHAMGRVAQADSIHWSSEESARLMIEAVLAVPPTGMRGSPERAHLSS